MRFVRTINKLMRKIFTTVFLANMVLIAMAQENDPFSRYGLGQSVPATNVTNRAMGGVSVAYSDFFKNSINFSNPATYSNFAYYSKKVNYPGRVIFDAGLDIDSRTLQQKGNSGESYNSANFIVNYLYFGVPVWRNADASQTLGVAFGLKPVTRINYKVQQQGIRVTDTATTIYEGSGGLNQVTIGAGYKNKGFSIGFNTGYQFGRKETNTDVLILNDTLYHYFSRSATNSTFGGLELQLGTQYEINLSDSAMRNGKKELKSRFLRLGATYTFNGNLSGKQSVLRMVSDQYPFNPISNSRIDTVFKQTDQSGSVNVPATLNLGLHYDEFGWSAGAEYESTDWTSFKSFGQTDAVGKSYKLRVGGHFWPAYFSSDNSKSLGFFSNLIYRAGFYTGREYITADGDLPVWGVTFGAGIPLRKTNNYTNQSTIINLNAEFGKIGNSTNKYNESFFRLSLGFSLADIWFIKRKYD
jgi:hypothetical protein